MSKHSWWSVIHNMEIPFTFLFHVKLSFNVKNIIHMQTWKEAACARATLVVYSIVYFIQIFYI